MNSPPRSWVFTLEFCLIVVPYSVIALFFAVAMVWPSLIIGWADAALSLALACVAITPLICGCCLSVSYLIGGEHKLASLRRGWWWGAYAGALVPIGGFVALLLYKLFGNFPILPVASDPEAQPFGPPRIGGPALGIIVAPLLIPLWHLSIMRRRTMRSNKSLNTDAPKDGAPVS